MTEDLKKILLQELTDIAESKGYSLLDLNYIRKTSAPSRVVVAIGKLNEEPVTIDDCAALSNDIAVYLDINDKIKEPYALEVGSKGCEDSLIFFNDFVRYIGRRVAIELHRAKDNSFEAQIVDANSGKVKLKRITNDDNIIITVPISSIKSSTLIKD